MPGSLRSPAGFRVGIVPGACRYRVGMAKKRWSELSPGARGAIVVGGVAELVVTTYALRDLVRRPGALVRGPKVVWLGSFVVQPFGPLLYLGVGRRPAPA